MDKQNKPKQAKKHMSKGQMIFWAVVVIFIVGSFINMQNHNQEIADRAEHTEEVKQAKKKKADKKKAKDENRYYANFLDQIKDASGSTDNLVTSAKMQDQALYLTINDTALTGTDEQTEKLVKSAWEYGSRMIDRFSPMPDDKVDGMIYVVDSNGNVLAKSTAMRNFRYMQ